MGKLLSWVDFHAIFAGWRRQDGFWVKAVKAGTLNRIIHERLDKRIRRSASRFGQLTIIPRSASLGSAGLPSASRRNGQSRYQRRVTYS